MPTTVLVDGWHLGGYSANRGIGTYLRALLPRVVRRVEGARFCVLGDPAAIDALSLGDRVEARAFGAGVYSALEQPGLFGRTPRDTRAFWAPHVNFPLAGPISREHETVPPRAASIPAPLGSALLH